MSTPAAVQSSLMNHFQVLAPTTSHWTSWQPHNAWDPHEGGGGGGGGGGALAAHWTADESTCRTEDARLLAWCRGRPMEERLPPGPPADSRPRPLPCGRANQHQGGLPAAASPGHAACAHAQSGRRPVAGIWPLHLKCRWHRQL
ncbi:putative uncharacterized protein FLJ45840 [Entelurus aequoreus]|uniref:putative uncharacterized protein FLJ45840 n=1 Tax=Entelurus aequoreus TaxID=161455 RepID=UPI002B1D522F|nr:putative uncharacterized protein FLJ45840 [Entelurus aequoreus]